MRHVASMDTLVQGLCDVVARSYSTWILREVGGCSPALVITKQNLSWCPSHGQERSDDITIIGIYIKDAEPGTRSPGTVAPLPSCAATLPASVMATRQHQLPDAEAAPLEPQSRRGSKKSTDQLDFRACDPVCCVRFCFSPILTPLSRIFTGT